MNKIKRYVYHIDWGGAEEWWVAESRVDLQESIKEHLGYWDDTELDIRKLPDDELLNIYWNMPKDGNLPEEYELIDDPGKPDTIDITVRATAKAWANWWEHDEIYLATTEF